MRSLRHGDGRMFRPTGRGMLVVLAVGQQLVILYLMMQVMQWNAHPLQLGHLQSLSTEPGTRQSHPRTWSIWPNQTAAAAPCVPPDCHFLCEPRPQHVDCDPGPPPPIISRTCQVKTRLQQTFHAISFAIPEEDVVACVPFKTQAFATIVPGKRDTYVFRAGDEAEYKRDYRKSYYGLTWRKNGWDCMRHYEIMASGAVPWFNGLESAPRTTLTRLPKDMLKAARDMEGVKENAIDPAIFDKRAYYQHACKMLEYTRKHLTTRALARYVLEAMGRTDAKTVLMLSGEDTSDYTRDLLLHGLRRHLGHTFVDYPAVAYMYDYPPETPVKGLGNEELYGYGFSYAHRLPDDPRINRTHIAERIQEKEFDIVIYGSVQRGMSLLDLVLESYNASSVAFIDGEDWEDWNAVRNTESWSVMGKGFYFMREMPDSCPSARVRAYGEEAVEMMKRMDMNGSVARGASPLFGGRRIGGPGV